jgi:hypothetical protein
MLAARLGTPLKERHFLRVLAPSKCAGFLPATKVDAA